MTLREFIKTIFSRKKVFIIVFILFLLASALITSFESFKYGTSLKLLTVHNFRENTDPYLASKSNEYLSGLLSKIIYSSSFFNKVKESGNIDKNYFSGASRKQIKKWEKTIKAKSLGDSGIISLDVYHPDREQAEEIARTVAYVLQTNHSLYHGYGKNVDIKIIDEPITSAFPVKPTFFIVLLVTISASVIFSLFYIYFFPANAKGKKNLSADAYEGEAGNSNWKKIGEIINGEDFDDRYGQKEETGGSVQEENFTDRGDMANILNRR